MYAMAFEEADALARLEAFASCHGADFYRLPRNTVRVRLERRPWQMPEQFAFGESTLVPLAAGETLPWKLQ